MADITMCQNKECPLSKNCYRFTAKPNDYSQSYSDFKPVYNKEYNEYQCVNFWSNEG